MSILLDESGGVIPECEVLEGASSKSWSLRRDVLGSGCTHCTDVPCQLRVASVHDTNACVCKMSMLSIDTTLSMFGTKSLVTPFVSLDWTTSVAVLCLEQQKLQRG